MGPPQDQFFADGNGLTAWSATFDSIQVRPDGDGRRITITVRDAVVYDRALTPQEADHLAGLLASSPSRATPADQQEVAA